MGTLGPLVGAGLLTGDAAPAVAARTLPAAVATGTHAINVDKEHQDQQGTDSADGAPRYLRPHAHVFFLFNMVGTYCELLAAISNILSRWRPYMPGCSSNKNAKSMLFCSKRRIGKEKVVGATRRSCPSLHRQT